MEILRSWGLEAQVRAGAADVETCGWVTRTLACGEGKVLPLGHPTAAEAARVSPTGPAWVPQDDLEPILLGRLRSSGLAEVRFGCELSALAQDDDGVTAALRDASSGREGTMRVRNLIGADGRTAPYGISLASAWKAATTSPSITGPSSRRRLPPSSDTAGTG
jgi:putative polyketide hydroxylase